MGGSVARGAAFAAGHAPARPRATTRRIPMQVLETSHPILLSMSVLSGTAMCCVALYHAPVLMGLLAVGFLLFIATMGRLVRR